MMPGRLPSILIQVFILLALASFPAPVFAAPLTQGEDPASKADALYDAGITHFNQGDYQAAIDSFTSALAIYEEIGDQEALSQTLHTLGFSYSLLGEYTLALDYEKQALAAARELRDPSVEEIILHSIGQMYSSLGQYPLALDYLQQALAISREIDDWQGEEAQLFHIGQAYYLSGEYQQALDSYQQSLVIAQERGDRSMESVIFNEMGEAQLFLGQYQQALDSYQQALSISQELGERPIELKTLQNLGQLHLSLGKYTQALDYSRRSLAIAQETDDSLSESKSLSDIGLAYANLGQDQQATEYFQRSLEISREQGHREGEAIALSNLAQLTSSPEQAVDYLEQVLEFAKESGNQSLEAVTLNNIGHAYERLGQYDQAGRHYEEALALQQELGNRFSEAVILNNLGFIHKQQGETEQALERYQRSLKMLQELDDQTMTGTTLNNLGRIYEQQGDIVQAIEHYQQAIEVTERIGNEIKVDEFRTAFLAEDIDRFEALVNVLWTAGRMEEAFHYTERARARVFLDQLGSGSINFRSGVDKNLLEREQALRSEITDLRSQLVNLRGTPQDESGTEAIADVQAELTARETDYARLLSDIKLQSPEVAGLVSVDVPSLADVQSLLDPNTTLVEYFVMSERTLAFIITKDSFETIAADVHRDDLSRTIQDFRDFASLGNDHPVSLRQLHAWLIAPLKDKLKTPVVGLIPHSTLHYVPFAALTDGQRYFGEEYSLFTLPSASVLRFIQEKRKPETNMVLALGNPAISEPGLAPLQFAEKEVEGITNLFESRPLTGASATESALRSHASSAGIIHLAAHGQYNSSNPLFSAIYLAEDEQQDGRLEVHEIYSLDLTQATDLVVLSACETQVGEISAGDEVVGMTRAFLYAGTSSVIASLWKVDDQTTALLMKQFYKHLQEGMGKAQALQVAQNEIRQEYPHPYYWAAFVLTGDPGSYVPPTSPSILPDGARNVLPLRRDFFFIGLCCFALTMILVGGMVWWGRRKRDIS